MKGKKEDMKNKIETKNGFPFLSRPVGLTGYAVMQCPKCKFEFSHTMSAGTIMGSSSAEAEVISGTQIIDTTPLNRSALVVKFEGECGHVWSITFQQHEGQTFVSTELSAERSTTWGVRNLKD